MSSDQKSFNLDLKGKRNNIGFNRDKPLQRGGTQIFEGWCESEDIQAAPGCAEHTEISLQECAQPLSHLHGPRDGDPVAANTWGRFMVSVQAICRNVKTLHFDKGCLKQKFGFSWTCHEFTSYFNPMVFAVDMTPACCTESKHYNTLVISQCPQWFQSNSGIENYYRMNFGRVRGV